MEEARLSLAARLRNAKEERDIGLAGDEKEVLAQEVQQLYQSLKGSGPDGQFGVDVPGARGKVIAFATVELQKNGHREKEFPFGPEPFVEILDTFDVTVLVANERGIHVATVPITFQTHKEEYAASELQPQAILAKLCRDAQAGELPEYSRISGGSFSLAKIFSRSRVVDLSKSDLGQQTLEHCKAQLEEAANRRLKSLEQERPAAPVADAPRVRGI